MGLFVSLLRPFARGQQAGGFNLAITSLQCRRKVPWGLTCLTGLPACLPWLPVQLSIGDWKLQPKGSNRRHSRSLIREGH